MNKLFTYYFQIFSPKTIKMPVLVYSAINERLSVQTNEQLLFLDGNTTEEICNLLQCRYESGSGLCEGVGGNSVFSQPKTFVSFFFFVVLKRHWVV